MNDIVYIPKRLIFLASTIVVLLIGTVVSLYAVRQPTQTQTQIHAQTVSPNGQPVCKDQTPHDIILVFDVSSSMTTQADPNTGASRLDEAKAAAKNFIQYFQGVNSKISNANQRFQIGLVRFSDYIHGTPIPNVTQNPDDDGGYYQGPYQGPMDSRVMNGLTQNFPTLTSPINNMEPPTVPNGQDYAFTCTQCGIRLANSVLTANNVKRDGRKKTVIILTDGHANWRQNTTTYTMINGDSIGENTVDNAAYNELNGNITYYTIGVGDDINTSFLQSIANRTGGTYQPSNTGSNLTQLYTNIANTIVTPATGKISGYIYNDINHNQKYDNPPDQPLKDWKVTITDPSGTQYFTQSDVNGYYEFPGLCAGRYTIVETPQLGWIATPGPSTTVTIGDGGSGSANFGNYLSSSNWIQSEAFDVRIDQGFTDSFPPIVNSQWQGAYASVPNASFSKTPGVILGGSDAEFINGQASKDPYNWMVGTLRFPERFSNKGPLSLSYASAYAKAYADGKQAPPDITCKPDACSLLGISSGYYHSSVPLTFNGLLVQSGSSYTIMVDGDVTINKAITVMPGGFLMIISSGSIMVDQSVGVPAGSTADAQLQGFFVADKDFVVLDNGKTCLNGGISDNALYVAGNIVVNASRQGGRFVQQRKLCGTDAYNPVLRATPRLDMLLNFPNFLRTPTKTWKEVAP